MKVLIATGIYPPDIGGPATYSKLLFDELPHLGVSVKVLSFGEVRHLPKIIRHIAYFKKVLKLGKGADIIFAGDPVSVGLPTALGALFLRKKFLLRIAGDYAWEQYQQRKALQSSNSKIQTPNENQFVSLEDFQKEKFDLITEIRRYTQRFVAKRAVRIIVPSNYLKGIVGQWGIKEEKITVIYNVFSPEEINESKEELRKKFNLHGRVIISAGRMVPWKGFDFLIRIMPKLLKAFSDITLIIAGSGPLNNDLKERVRDLKLEKTVIFTGQLNHRELLQYVYASELFVLNTGYEGFSHQLLEVMSLGVPVVTTKIGGNPELIENEKEGILVDYDNEEAFTKAILCVLSNQPLGSSLALKAKEKTRQFNKQKMLEELHGILKELISHNET